MTTIKLWAADQTRWLANNFRSQLELLADAQVEGSIALTGVFSFRLAPRQAQEVSSSDIF